MRERPSLTLACERGLSPTNEECNRAKLGRGTLFFVAGACGRSSALWQVRNRVPPFPSLPYTSRSHGSCNCLLLARSLRTRCRRRRREEEEGPGFCLCWVLPPASLLSLFSKLFIKLENGRDAEESQSTQQRDSDLLMQKPQKSNREKTES